MVDGNYRLFGLSGLLINRVANNFGRVTVGGTIRHFFILREKLTDVHSQITSK